MKKFYTLLAAAAVTLSAAAAPTLAKKMVRTFEPAAFDASKVPALRLQKPAAAKDVTEVSSEVYAYSYYSLADEQTWTGICEFSSADAQSVTLLSFISPDFVIRGGEVDAANATVSFPAQFLAQMSDGTNQYDMWIYAAELSADQTELILTPDAPIAFQINADGTITGLNQLLVICAEGNPDVAYDFVLEVAMEESDDWAKLSYKTCGVEGGYFTPDITESIVSLHGANLADGVLTLSDVFYLGVDMPVTIDYAAGTATIEPTILAQLNQSYYLAVVGISADGSELTGIDGVLESPNTIVWTNDWGFGVTDANGSFQGFYEYNLGGKIITGFRLDGSGVKDVAVDANAPVEYYNLQGVRVAEPTNGIYIRRQGNTASKVLVVR